MKKIKCSRCRKSFNIDDYYPYKECPRCHQRTVKRMNQIRKHKPKKFDYEKLFQFPTWREFVSRYKQWYKRKHLDKATLEKLKREYEFRREEFFRENKFKLEKLAKIFHTKEYPFTSRECLKIRAVVLEHFHEGEEWDIIEVTNHIADCKPCNQFMLACKRGDFYFEPLEPSKEEGYCSLEEWNQALNEFWKTMFKNAIEPKEEPINDLTKKLYETMLHDYHRNK